MSKQRVRADNFEQLIEIVKAVQRGKDPEESLREKEEQELRELLAQEEGEEEIPEEERTPEEQQEDERAISRLLRRWLPENRKEKTAPEPDEELGQTGGESPELDEESEQPGEGSPEDATPSARNTAEKQRKGAAQRLQPLREKFSALGSRLRERTAPVREDLAQRGFRHKELLMAAAGLLLAVCVVALIVHSVLLSRSEKRKMEGVTADEGLTVLVEQKPERWCQSYPVELTVRAKGADVQKATVNGTSYMLDEAGRLTAKVSEPTLEVSVDTEQGTLRASVEIPLIDAQPPIVNVTRDKDQITVKAGDARSEIAKIRYAVVPDNAVSNVPEYMDYSEPLTFEEDCTYYFYAQDAAGNRCSPLETTMEIAQKLSLERESADLYPGEVIYLTAQAEPEGALLNNLKYTSANPEVLAVDSTGKVTAVGTGTTVVTVSADDVKEASCKVTVGEERTVTISAIGDCTLGTDANFNSQTSFDAFDVVNGHSWFFQNVKDILSEDDATFANLEGTLTTETQRETKEYAFKGDPSYTQILKNGSIDVVTLANNHSSDYGPQSLTDTKQYLTEAGIDYCQDTEIAVKDVNGIATAFIGIYVLDDGMDSEKELRAAIEAAKEREARLIIVAFHWGAEKQTQPDATQQELAHIAVDCGANLVVGHHPHVLQGIEKYNGAYIVYSLGNFCFGGNSTPSDMDSMIFRQTFTVTRDGVLDNDQIEIIPCSISSDPYYNNYQPTPAADAEAERILGRINEYSAAFGMSYTASGVTPSGDAENPGAADDAGDTGAANTGTADGATGSGAADAGVDDTGAVDTGAADDAADAGVADAGAADIGAADTGAANTDTADDAADSGAANGAADADAGDAGAADSGAADGAADTGGSI